MASSLDSSRILIRPIFLALSSSAPTFYANVSPSRKVLLVAHCIPRFSRLSTNHSRDHKSDGGCRKN